MAVAPTLNTYTGKQIAEPTKTYYFLINRVIPTPDNRLDVTLLGHEILESADEVKEVISSYLPLGENCELCIYRCDELYIKHWKAHENPTIEDVLELVKF